ncbi:type VII secretion protein EccE [Rhodococcus sp. NPDC058514]|uniref:type VII secretion protein EccE n=1 Tax=unclassified Rhodococcus (in: high G+C Gram-positive bacteria) TaxID=192944 RepID=UPI003656751B
MSVRNLVVAQLLGAAAGAVAAAFGLTWWPAVAIGAVVALLGLIPLGGRCLLDWVATGGRYLLRREHSPGQTSNFRTPSGPVVGLHWDGGSVVAVIEVLPTLGNLTQVTRDAFESVHRLPVLALAESMTQQDISLSGIDIVSHGYRASAGSPATEVYDQLVGPLPATALRTVWLAVRFDATAESEAVARRGGGTEGAARTASVAALRIVRALSDAGCESRLLTAAEIDSAAMQISRGVRPGSFTRTWTHTPLPGVCNTGYAIDPRVLSDELLAKLWVPSSLGTTVTVRMRPGARPGEVRVAASCRMTTRTMPERLEIPGLISMQGRHADGLASNLPFASPDLDTLTPFTDFSAAELDALALPLSGCGQLIGSDNYGHGLTARIVGPEIESVDVLGELYLAQQLVFRAIATGARIQIHSDRPQVWGSLIDSIATPDRLRLIDDPTRLDPTFTAVLFDGVEPVPPRAGVTTIRVRDVHEPAPDAEPQISIVQPGASGDRVTLRADGRQVDLVLVTIAQETAFIGRPRATHPLQPAR